MCIRNVLKKASIKVGSSIDEFRASLVKQNKFYLLATEMPANKVYLQFEGVLNKKAVVWHTCIRTIDEYAEQHFVESDPKQFIDIKIDNKNYLLEIALNIQQIDKAVIERTIIMMRKYKRLQPGRHEYGARSKTR